MQKFIIRNLQLSTVLLVERICGWLFVKPACPIMTQTLGVVQEALIQN